MRNTETPDNIVLGMMYTEQMWVFMPPVMGRKQLDMLILIG